MLIGLYFGSFNPVHVGHLIIANHLLNETSLQKIWFVVSPLNPLKVEADLLDEHERLALVRAAVEQDERISASDIEFYLSKPSYTINTLATLKERYPKEIFSIIMGSDTFNELDRWKDFERILEDYKIFIYGRRGAPAMARTNANTEVLNAPRIDISSTMIREMIQKGKSIRYLVPENVRRAIEEKKHYKR